MPVLEDGLSDSENISGDEQSSPSPVVTKSNNRHQSTQIDLNHSPLIPSHKHQHAKSINNELESQSKSFYIRPQVPSSTVRTDQPKISSEESSTIPTGKILLMNINVLKTKKENLDKKLRKKGLFRMYIFHFVVARLFKIGLILNKYCLCFFFNRL